MKVTYKDFGEALDELRVEHDYSYDRLALKLGIANSYVYHIINRRMKTLPSNELVEKIAKFFNLEPEYFYEYRLRKMLELVDKNREYLDYCQKEFDKWSKKERQKTENKSEQDKSA